MIVRRFLILCLLTSIFSCGLDPINSPTVVNTSIYGKLNHNSSGFIFNGNKSERQILIDGKIFSLLANGSFEINNLELLNVRQPITFFKEDGTFLWENHFNFIPVENEISYIVKDYNFDFSGGEIRPINGGTVEANNGIIMDIPSQTIVNSQNEYVDQWVFVACVALNPITNRINHQFPGDLITINDNIKEGLNVLAGANIQIPRGDYSIEKNKSIVIKIPLHEDLVDSAPTTIDLWKYNDISTLWEPSGLARLEGGHYIIEISAFGNYCVATTYEMVDISAKVNLKSFNNGYLDDTNEPIRVTTTGMSSGILNESYTIPQGAFVIKAPKNEDVLLELTYNCSAPIYIATLEPLTEDLILETIDSPTDEEYYDTITGKAVDCNGTPLDNAVFEFTSNNSSYIQLANTDKEGNFEIYTPECDVHYRLNGYDISSLKEMFLPGLGGTKDLGEIEFCEDLDYSYVLIKIQREKYDDKTFCLSGAVDCCLSIGSESPLEASFEFWKSDLVYGRLIIGEMNYVEGTNEYQNVRIEFEAFGFTAIGSLTVFKMEITDNEIIEYAVEFESSEFEISNKNLVPKGLKSVVVGMRHLKS